MSVYGMRVDASDNFDMSDEGLDRWRQDLAESEGAAFKDAFMDKPAPTRREGRWQTIVLPDDDAVMFAYACPDDK